MRRIVPASEGESNEQEDIKYFSSHRRRNLTVLAVVLVVIVAVALFYEFVVIPRNTPSATFTKVEVMGVVLVKESGETPTSVDFTAHSGSVLSSIVATGGSYVLFLPNGQTYSTTIHWRNTAGVNGTCAGQPLSLNVARQTYSFNPSC